MRPFVQHYDAIYNDKDYRFDTEILRGLVKTLHRPAILEIGSGTGNQSLLLSQWADVTAVETDADFTQIMQRKLSTQSIELFCGDIGALAKDGFDGAAAYFHVVNYIHEQNALVHLLNEIARRLKPGAVFLFDMWHAECVLHDPPKPVIRAKSFDNHIGKGKVLQHIIPHMDVSARRISLDYNITVEYEQASSPAPFTERIDLHLWRRDEIVDALAQAGFHDTQFFDARLYPQALSAQSWTACVVAQQQ